MKLSGFRMTSDQSPKASLAPVGRSAGLIVVLLAMTTMVTVAVIRTSVPFVINMVAVHENEHDRTGQEDLQG